MDALEYSLQQIDVLSRRGQDIVSTLASDDDQPSLAAMRIWQRDCAALVNELSGGSKAHWLSRAYSASMLVRRSGGEVLVEAPPSEIAQRILDVLAKARASLMEMSRVQKDPAYTLENPAYTPSRFEFVREAALRPVLQQVVANSQTALARGEFALALLLACGALDTLITDALESHGQTTAGWSFDDRIAAAERLRVINSGCTRLSATARRYRDLADEQGHVRADASVSERDARVAGQVLRVIMRDLDPGR